VLIFGDSIADQQGRHAAVALEEIGVRVRVEARWGWGLFTRDQYDMGARQESLPATSMLARASVAVTNFDPDVVAVYTNHNIGAPLPRDAAGEPIDLGSAGFAPMAESQLGELLKRLTVNGATVYLVEPPPPVGTASSADNLIWAAYLSLQPKFGFGVIHSGDVLADPSGASVDTMTACDGTERPVHRGGDDADILHLSYFGSGLMGTATARALAEAVGRPSPGMSAPAERPVALLPAGLGYRIVTCDGATFRFERQVPSFGSVAFEGNRTPGDPVVAATTTALGRRGWAITRAGQVFAFDGAPELGQPSLVGANHGAVGIASTHTAEGYWIATSFGVVQHFGDATPLGDLAGQGETVVAMASTPDRQGYWLLTASGRVEPFGTAASFGDLREALPDAALVGLAAHPSGKGYWVLDETGAVHPFGAAVDSGSAAGQDLVRFAERGRIGELERVPASQAPTTAVGMLSTLSGSGYWVMLASGAVCHFGDAPSVGGLHISRLEAALTFIEEPFYGDGPCGQDPDSEPWNGRPLGHRSMFLG
jgi:hypothetical protein